MNTLPNNAILQQLAELSGDAIKVIQTLLTDERTAPSVKLRAAKLVLDAAVAVNLAENEPEPQPKQATAAVAALPNEPAQPAVSRKVVAMAPIVKPPRIGRNDLCPCGSGLKHKKCCLNKISPHTQNASLARCA